MNEEYTTTGSGSNPNRTIEGSHTLIVSMIEELMKVNLEGDILLSYEFKITAMEDKPTSSITFENIPPNDRM